jgi:sulfide:quinone oxidoreductase
MEIKQLSATFSVTGQVTPAVLEEAARLGFTAVVCNRPDGEAAEQPSSLEMATAAARAGLAFEYIPVEPGQPFDREACLLGRFLASVEGPVLGYCRTGARSEAIWQRAGELSLLKN